MVKLDRLSEQMNLKKAGSGDPELIGITEDSRRVKPGFLFVAVPGLKFNGRDFIRAAIENGAAAVMLTAPDVDLSVPRLIVPEGELRPVMAGAASIIYGRPSDKMIVIGITGTNGKTSITYMMEAILARAGLAPGIMGTNNYRWPGTVIPAENTTPEGPVLVSNLAEMRAAGSRAAVLEVSSHALKLGRVTGVGFEATLFTNLTRDHLDFHPDLEDYFQSKKLLFTKHLKPGGKRAAINIDDPHGRRLAGELGEAALTFGFDQAAEVRAEELEMTRSGLKMKIVTPDQTWVQTSPLIGETNAYNLLGAAALAYAMHISPVTIFDALAEVAVLPGRLERVGANDDYLVLVDYSHTPDSLEKALKTCRDLEPNRVIVVVGAGGNRDKGKRPLMGGIAGKMADLVILTSDNPRTEEPWSILLDMEMGFEGLNLNRYEAGELSDDWNGGSYLMIVDRRAAIREAVRLMSPSDTLLIAGKGHEDYQIIGREKRHLDDRQEALEALTRAGRA